MTRARRLEGVRLVSGVIGLVARWGMIACAWILALVLSEAVGVAQSASPRGAPSLSVHSPTVGSRRPNVLVILADDFNRTDLDSVSTPNLDGLAGNGVTFRRAYSFPVCSPTRYGVLFGRYPRRDGIGRIVSFTPPGPDNPTPPLSLTSLAEALRFSPKGRMSTGIFGKWHLGSNVLFDNIEPDIGPYNLGALTPNLQGFGRWFGTTANLADYNSWRTVSDGIFGDSEEYASGAVLRELLGFWESSSEPRFAYYAPHNAHADYHAPPPELLPPGYPVPRGRREEFEAMIVSLDFIVGRILETVDLTDTFVIFMADNGTPRGVAIHDCPPRPQEPFNPFDCAKHTVWEPGIRVPMFVAGPGVVAGSESHALVSCIDVMATVCDLLGLPSPGEDSVSFAPSLVEPTYSARRYVFSEIFGEFDLFIGGPAMKFESTAIGPRYKLRRLNGLEQVFDLLTDPLEAVPLPLDDPNLAQELAAMRAVLDDPLERGLQVR